LPAQTEKICTKVVNFGEVIFDQKAVNFDHDRKLQ